ncbi:MAG: glycosyltransferase family 4 protein [Steroidobacterales bacterium]
MKFLFIDSSRGGWGTEQHLVSLASGLAAAGHGVVAVVKAGSAVERLLRRAGVTVYPTAFRGGADPRGLWTAARAIARHSPDWLVINRSKLYWTVWLLGRMMGVPIAAFRHLPYIRPYLTRCLFPRLVDRFFVVSDFARRQLASEGAPAERLLRLYNPIETDRFQPNPALRQTVRRELGLNDADVLAAFVGRIERGKGVIQVCEALHAAMAQSSALRMLWVGDGGGAATTRALAAAGGYAQRHAFVAWSADVERYYAAVDVLVAPSIECETFGRVIAEAQCCGVPVIVSNIGGMPEAFAPGHSGILVAPQDSAALSRGMLLLAGSAELRAAMGAAGRKYAVTRFGAAGISRKFVRHLCNAPTPVSEEFDVKSAS